MVTSFLTANLIRPPRCRNMQKPQDVLMDGNQGQRWPQEEEHPPKKPRVRFLHHLRSVCPVHSRRYKPKDCRLCIRPHSLSLSPPLTDDRISDGRQALVAHGRWGGQEGVDSAASQGRGHHPHTATGRPGHGLPRRQRQRTR